MEYGSLRFPYLIYYFLYNGVIHRGRKQRIVLFGVIAFQLFSLYITSLEIHRDINPHRPRSSRCGKVPALFQSIAYLRWVLNHHSIFGHWFYGLDDIIFLISHSPERTAICKLRRISGRCIISNLSADNEHGDGIQPSPYHSGQSIGPPRPCCHTDKGNSILQTGISLRCHGTCLFMMIVQNFQPLFVSQRIVQMHGSASNNAETICHTFSNKKIRYIIRKSLFHSLSPFRPSGQEYHSLRSLRHIPHGFSPVKRTASLIICAI